MAHILESMREKADLALIYADDGALHTAARVLNDLAAEVLAFAQEKDRAIAKLLGEEPRPAPTADPRRVWVIEFDNGDLDVVISAAPELDIQLMASEMGRDGNRIAVKVKQAMTGVNILADDIAEGGAVARLESITAPAGVVEAARMGAAALKLARDCFRSACADRTLERVKLALSSAKGAVRHAENKGDKARAAGHYQKLAQNA